MPQKQDKINTGIEGLDDDLRILFTIFQDKEKIDTINEAITNNDTSEEGFIKNVPGSLINLATFLTGPQFAILSDNIPDEAFAIVKKAKLLIEKHFGNLFENKIFISIMKGITRRQRDDSESLNDEIIQVIEYYLIWEDEPPELTPAARVAFKNRKKKILLNTRMDWEDLSYLLKRISHISVELLDKGKTLAELGQVDLSDFEKVSKNFEKTSENLQKIKELMPIYAPQSEVDTDEPSAEDAETKD